MTDWQLEVNLAIENDWRWLPNNVISGGIVIQQGVS